MTSDEFDALLARRDVLAHSHDLACQILAEEGESRLTRDTCLRTYFELEEVETLIKAECEAERLAENNEPVAFDLTFSEWLVAANRSDSASEYDLRAAWRAGEDPGDYDTARDPSPPRRSEQ